jgi:hypothetical protein
MWQTIVVIAIVVGAGGWLAVRLRGFLRGRGSCSCSAQVRRNCPSQGACTRGDQSAT